MGNASFLITFGLNDKRLVCWSLQFTREGLVIFFFFILQGEHALPEQFIHVYKDGHFETTPVSHSAGG